MKSVQYAIQIRSYDERKEVPIKCRECIWRTGRVCILPKCVRSSE